MTPEMLVSIGHTIEQGHRLLHSLYDSGDLSIDQYDGIAKALLATSELRKSIEADGDLLIEKAERIESLQKGMLDLIVFASVVCDPESKDKEDHDAAKDVLRAAIKNGRALLRGVHFPGITDTFGPIR